MAEVVMPQLGETVTEGTITRWFKQVGDAVAEDEILFEVSTDKVDSEVPSPVAGVLTEIKVPEGDTVEVGVALAVIGDAADAPAADAPAAEAPAADAPAPPPEASSEPPAAQPPAAPPPPVAAVAGAAAVDDNGDGDGDGDGRLLSPVVRRLVAEHGLDVGAIAGTGIGGRITRGDVEAVIQAGGGHAAPAPPSAAAPAPAAGSPAPAATAPAPARSGERETTRALSNIRLRTGEHMVSSKAASPHVLTAVEVDFEGVERVRQAHRAEWKTEEGFSLTYLPFVARAVVDAIADFPDMNASVVGNELVTHHYVNLAIAVDLDFQGLLAPVVRDVDTKRLRAISREVVDLAQRARAKKLSADEIIGGTFTITNPGQYGTLMQFPIINQPQVAILSTDGVRRKPVVVTDQDGHEAITIHSVGVLALAWDHRAFDGAYAAAFLARLREIIETRDWDAEVQ